MHIIVTINTLQAKTQTQGIVREKIFCATVCWSSFNAQHSVFSSQDSFIFHVPDTQLLLACYSEGD